MKKKMKKEYDFSKMKGHKNPHADTLKKNKKTDKLNLHCWKCLEKTEHIWKPYPHGILGGSYGCVICGHTYYQR